MRVAPAPLQKRFTLSLFSPGLYSLFKYVIHTHRYIIYTFIKHTSSALKCYFKYFIFIFQIVFFFLIFYVIRNTNTVYTMYTAKCRVRYVWDWISFNLLLVFFSIGEYSIENIKAVVQINCTSRECFFFFFNLIRFAFVYENRVFDFKNIVGLFESLNAHREGERDWVCVYVAADKSNSPFLFIIYDRKSSIRWKRVNHHTIDYSELKFLAPIFLSARTSSHRLVCRFKTNASFM